VLPSPTSTPVGLFQKKIQKAEKRSAQRTSIYCPLAPFAPRGGRVAFAAARGSRAGERLQKNERGCAPYPLIARAISAAASRRKRYHPSPIGILHLYARKDSYPYRCHKPFA